MPPYGHPVSKTTLLWPKAQAVILLFKEPLSSSHPIIQLEFSGPLVTDQ